MDQQLESLNLEDGNIGIDFDGGEQEVVTSECNFTTDESGMDHEIEVGQVQESDAMDTDHEVIDSTQYAEETTNNETCVLPVSDPSESASQIVVESTALRASTVVETKKVTTNSSVTRTSKVAIPAINQTYRVGGAALKPVSIAPKPITMSASGFANVRKYSLAGVQPQRLAAGRQVVVVPSSGHRFKMVGTPVRAQTPVQIQVRQRTVPPLTKLTMPSGKESASGLVAVQKSTPTRYITIPPQQVGLLGGKITQLVAVSPTKQPLATSTPTLRPLVQGLSAIKSPTKILPAPQNVTAGNKVLVTGGNSSFVVKQPPIKSGQVMKVDGSTIIASLPAGQKINPQQIHQINIPGKGVQYVRLVPAPGLATQSASSVTPVSTQSQQQAVTSVITTSSQTFSLTTAAGTTKKITTPQLLPKTFLITDYKNNIVQMVPGKGKSIINTTNSSNIKKIFTKATTKIVPISSAGQIVTDSQQSLSISNTEKHESMKGKPDSMLLSEQSSLSEQQKVTATSEQEVSNPQELDTVLVSQQEIIVNSDGAEEDEMDVMQDIGEHSSEDMMQDESVSDPLNVVMLPDAYNLHMQESQNFQKSHENDVKEELSDYPSKIIDSAVEFGMRPRKPCNCTKSQCLKLYCDCFANGEFCNQCNCNNCFNNLDNEEYRQKAIRSCLDRNPNAFRPKIGKAKNNVGLDVVRRHNKGCNCKRSGCLKNYCECYEGKIACSANCKCVGCRNVEDAIDKKILRRSRVESVIGLNNDSFNNNNSHMSLSNNGGASKSYKQESLAANIKSPCNIMTNDVIEAVCQCLIAQAADAESTGVNISGGGTGGARKVLEEFAHCLKDIISVAQQHKSATSVV